MNPAGRPLRVGLLLDEPNLPWWIAPAFQDAAARGIARVELAVLRREPASGRPQPVRPLRWWKNRRHLGYALLDRLDRRRARRQPLPADLSLDQLSPGVARLDVVPKTSRWIDRLDESDVEAVRRHQLDLLIRIGFRILHGSILSAARHGVWSFHHGDNRRYRGGPPGVWEVLQDHPESGVTLQRLTEELDGGEVLARLVTTTRRFSFEQNLRSLLGRSAPMLLTSLERLQRSASPVQLSGGEEWSGYPHRLYRAPTNGELARALPRLAVRYLKQRARSAGRKLQWSLGWHYTSAPNGPAEQPHGVLYRYREITPPRDRFWADPFIVHDGERWWMFFEEYRYAGGRGELAVWEMGANGPIGAPRIVLTRPYHLSYPQVFHAQGAWHLVPETAAERKVELLTARRFPDDWEPRATLLADLKAVDPTLLSHEGHWYLFTAVDDALHAYVSRELTGPYQPHPENPLVTDIRWSRMAGRFFHARGRLYRPAQRGSPSYGAGLVVAEVIRLTPDCYAERIVERLDPYWDAGLRGMHTLNAADGLSVVDFLRLVRH